MRTGNFVKLLAVTVVVALAIVLVLQARGADTTAPAGTGPLFPDLTDHVNDVSALTVTSSQGTVTVRRDGDTWRIDERGGYPARFELVKSALLGVADLVALDSRTAKPELYGKLGLQDPEQTGSDSTLLTLTGPQGSALASVIVGHMGQSANTLYVRRAADAQTWLARGSLAPERLPTGWMDRDLIKLARGRVREVTVSHEDGEKVVVSHEKQEDSDWSLHDVPDGKEPISPAAGRPLGTALELLNFDDVAKADSQPLPSEDRVTTVFETFDGLRLMITSATATTEGPADATAADPAAPTKVTKIWAAITAEPTESATEAVKTEAAELQARITPWVFQLSEYRGGTLRKRMADLVKDKAPPTPPETPDGMAAPDNPAPDGAPMPEPVPVPVPPTDTPPTESPKSDLLPSDSAPGDKP